MALVREKQLGDILVEHGVITPLELDEALQRQRLTNEMMGRVLVKMGLCEEQDIVEALGVQAGMERVDVTKLQVKEDVLRRLTPDIAKFYNVVPVRETNGVLTVAMATLSEDELAKRAAETDALVVMKIGRNLPKLRRALERAGRADDAWLVERGTMPGQTVQKLSEIEGEVPYFSIVLVHGKGRRP